MAGAAIGGGLVGGLMNILGGVMQGEYAKGMQQKAFEFAEHAARHQYQWAMEDMRKAGLNPMLAYMQGGAKVSSQGVGGGISNPNIAAGLAAGVSSAKAVARHKQEMHNLEMAGRTEENRGYEHAARENVLAEQRWTQRQVTEHEKLINDALKLDMPRRQAVMQFERDNPELIKAERAMQIMGHSARAIPNIWKPWRGVSRSGIRKPKAGRRYPRGWKPGKDDLQGILNREGVR